MNRFALLSTIAFLLFYGTKSTAAQEKCSPPPIPIASPGSNIFTDLQEVDLGDVVAEQVERNFRVIHDDVLASYANQVAARILAQIPATQLHVRVILVDLPVVNAFSLPGGRIYVARRMVAFVRNDDELAGLLGHEMGHILSHQGAVRMTRLFREVLSVSSVGDRKDILDKFNRLLDSAHRDPKAFRSDISEEEPHQYQADLVGLYAVANAGYSPAAIPAMWDRLAQTEGKSGNVLTDLLGITKPAQKRLREMEKSFDQLPAACRVKTPASPSDEFLAWQTQVIAYSGLGRTDSLIGVVDEKDLDPPLRSDITHLRFSPDGKYVLAQDDSSVFVLTRQPFELVLRIDAPEADMANFTPDSASVVFSSHGTRVEQWSIAEQQRTSVHEVIVPGGCVQTLLSPDGKALACLNEQFSFSIVEVSSGKYLFNDAGYFRPNDPWGLNVAGQILFREELFGYKWLHIQFSPDSRYVIAASEKRLCVDLASGHTVPLHGMLGDMASGGFTFLGPDRILAEDQLRATASALVEFPSGRILKWFPKLSLLRQHLTAASHGDYVIVSPVKDASAGVLDLNSMKVFTGPLRRSAIDAYDGFLLAEKTSGEIGIFNLAENKLEVKTSLPAGPFGRLSTVSVSPDLSWLAVSGRTRGAVWNLNTGKRWYLTRAFHGAYFDSGRVLYADFPKIEGQERTMVALDLARPNIGQGIVPNDDFGAVQLGPYIISRKRPSAKGSFRSNVTLEVEDARDAKLLWSRNFPNEAPMVRANPAGNILIFYWSAREATAKDEIKNDASLSRRFATLDHEGVYLLEVIEGLTGKVMSKMLLDTGKGSFRITNVTAEGDWMLVTDNDNRTLAYSLSSGERKAALFGSHSSVSEAAQALAIGNEAGEIDIYSLPMVKKCGHLSFSSPVSVASFSSNGQRLFVLTANQTAYLFDTAQLLHESDHQSNGQ